MTVDTNTTNDTDTTDEADQLDDTEQDVEVQGDEDAPEAEDTDQDADDAEPDEDAETFSRPYVERLRRENQKYRDQARTADTLARRLHTALVAATGKLADPTDLEFDAAHLDEADGPDALTAAIDELIDRKPHLASRRPVGDIGQGATRTSETVDLAGILRARA